MALAHAICTTLLLKNFCANTNRYGFLISIKFHKISSRMTTMATSGSITKPKVFVTISDLPEKIGAVLGESCEVVYYVGPGSCPRDVLLTKVKDKDALYCIVTDKVNAELLDAAGSKLRAIGTMSVGHDHIDLDECRKRNITIGYTPGVLTDATADLTVALLLAAARRIVEGTAEVKNGGWSFWKPFWMNGQDLSDSTVGIVGLGRIGIAVLKRLKPFGVRRFLYCGNGKKPEGDALNATFVNFEELLRESDFVVVCCSLTDCTTGMFDSSAFSKMKSNAVFVNTSRGLIVDQDALYAALTSGQIWGAGIDVTYPEPLPPNHQLTTLTNCVISPHIGSSTTKTREKMALMTVENIIAALKGTNMPAKLC